MNKLIIPLKHYNDRSKNIVIDLIIIHYISARNLNKQKWDDLGLILGIFGAVEWRGRIYVSSAHYVIERTGRLIETVHPDLRAWHAGKSEYNGKSNCNSYSIGIEIVGGSFIDFMPEQYDSLNELIKYLKGIYPIKNITGHENVALPRGRKRDPGSRFNWQKVIL